MQRAHTNPFSTSWCRSTWRRPTHRSGIPPPPSRLVERWQPVLATGVPWERWLDSSWWLRLHLQWHQRLQPPQLRQRLLGPHGLERLRPPRAQVRVRHCGIDGGHREARQHLDNATSGPSPAAWRLSPRMNVVHQPRSGRVAAARRGPACRQC